MQAFLKTAKLDSGGSSSKESKSVSLSQKKPRCTPWVEKYRPRTVDDVVEQTDVIAVLQQILLGADLPNLLFYGPPGTGKTSTILAAARQLFGDIYKDRILELNASDERGIQVIRDKVKTFAQRTASGVRPDGRACPAFKIVILDEADSMTHAAQAALRRTMERETKSTRFCLICNYVSRIIQPLTSRCSKFRFKPLGEGMLMERLELICKQEGMACNRDVMRALVDTSGGDMRRALTSLQSCHHLKGKGAAISVEDVLEVTGVVPDNLLTDLLDVCNSNDYGKLSKNILYFTLEAYSASQLLEQLHERVVFNKELSDKKKTIICEKLALCSWRIQDGACEYIELMDLCCTIMGVYQM